MEDIVEILNDILKSTDLKTVTKAELKQRYLKEKGLLKLPKEERQLFSAAAEKACRNFINEKEINIGPSSEEENRNENVPIMKVQETAEDNKEEKEYIVEKIIDKRLNGDNIEYLLKWEGYSDADNTWEPVDQLECYELIDEYEKNSNKSLKENKDLFETVLNNSDVTGKQVNNTTNGLDNDTINVSTNESDDKNGLIDLNNELTSPSKKMEFNTSKIAICEETDELLSLKQNNEALRMPQENNLKDGDQLSKGNDELSMQSVNKNLENKTIAAGISNDSEDEPLTFYKKYNNNEKKESDLKNLKDEFIDSHKRKVNKHIIYSDSDDESLISIKNNSQNQATCTLMNKRIIYSDSDDEPLRSVKNDNQNQVTHIVNSSESDEEPLIFKKNLKQVICNVTSESDEEPLPSLKGASQKQTTRRKSSKKVHKEIKVAGNYSVDTSDSKGKFVTSSKKHSRKQKFISNSSDSDDETPLVSFKNKKQKLFEYSRDSDDKKSFKNQEENGNIAKNSVSDLNEMDCNSNNSVNKSFKSRIIISSDSEDVPLVSLKNQNHSPLVRWDSDKPPLSLNSNQKKKNSKQKHYKKGALSLSGEDEKVGNSPLLNKNAEILENSSVNSFAIQSSNNFSDIDEEPLISVKNNDFIKHNDTNKTSVLNSSDSDEPLSSIKKNKSQKTQISDDEPILTVKNNKRQKMKVIDDKTNINHKNDFTSSVLSDSCDSEEPLVSIKKASKKQMPCALTSDSEDETLTNLKSLKNNNFIKNVNSEGSFFNSGDSDEPLSSVKKRKKENKNSDVDSDDEPLLTIKTNKNRKPKVTDNETNKNVQKNDFTSKVPVNVSNSEEEPLVSIKKASKKHSPSMLISDSEEPLENIKSHKNGAVSNSMDDNFNESSEVNSKKKRNSAQKFKKNESEQNGIKDIKKSAIVSSDSEDEPLAEYSKQKKEIADVQKLDNDMESSDDSSNSSINENEEEPIGKKSKSKNACVKSSKEKRTKQDTRKLSASENKLEHLKKYIRAAGIRIQSYTKLFENCKSMKAKCEKLISMLEKEGLKGRPTLEKCKKIKKRIEKKKEIAELDVSNIIVSKGRTKRAACVDTTNYEAKERSPPLKSKFSRLQDIVDSEESD